VFDISFAELMIIAVVGLLVIGPDKLPQVARTLGAFMGRLQRYVAQVKEEVNREARFEELQNLQQEIKKGVNQVQSSIMDGANKAQSTIEATKKSVKSKAQPAVSKPTESTVKKPSVKKAPVKPLAAKKVAIQKSSVKTTKRTVKKTPTAQKIEKA
jgi:sec-independent protein translocase protein TatB